MFEIDTANSNRSVWLRAFLESSMSLRTSQPKLTNLQDRVVLFLGSAKKFAVEAESQRRPLEALPRYVPSVSKLALTLGALKGPLQKARAGGEFIEIWSVAGLKRKEVRNAAILAWLLDPRGTHGCGTFFLHRLVKRASQQVDEWPPIYADLSAVTVRTEEAPLGSNRDRVDIAIDGPSFVLFVEVKIDAPEGLLQLARYVEAAQQKARALNKSHALVIYVSPRRPANAPRQVPTLSWRDIAAILSNAPSTGISRVVIDQYANHIRSFF